MTTDARVSTKIAGRDVPIEPGDLVTIQFSGGRGGQAEAGMWQFWTIFNDRLQSTARCREGSDPGERFRRMEGAKGYERPWQVAVTSKAIRPATLNEVIGWLKDHNEDSQFVEGAHIGAKSLKVRQTAQGVWFE
jgi:hypothetical protein